MCVCEREIILFFLLIKKVQFTDVILSAYNTQPNGAGKREYGIMTNGQDCFGTRIT